MSGGWTEEEDNRLVELVKRHGPHWTEIAEYFSGRKAPQISGRWNNSVNPDIKKGSFTSEEDDKIREYMRSMGNGLIPSWRDLAGIVPRRTPKQCRERWQNHLDPNVCSEPWSPEEDDLIFNSVPDGREPKWSQIAIYLPGRTANAIKNRWHGSIKKRISHNVQGARVLRHLPRPKEICRKNVIQSCGAASVSTPPLILQASPTPIGRGDGSEFEWDSQYEGFGDDDYEFASFASFESGKFNSLRHLTKSDTPN
jgi:hypothetical protein